MALAFAAPHATQWRQHRRASITRNDGVCSIRMTASVADKPPAPPGAFARLASAALSVKAVRRAAMAAGRRKVVRDAESIGLDWAGEVAALRAVVDSELEPRRAALAQTSMELPEYYLAPFHAYENGNLGWLPALEAEVSSRGVHARHSTTGNPLDGDGCLRGKAAQIIAERWKTLRQVPPGSVLDVGCSVGLSTANMEALWSQATFTGVDPSAEMLAVAAYRYPQLQLVHGIGERLRNEWGDSFDVVSVQLVVHELPDDAFRSILREAHRVLRPGGLLAVMDVDPAAFDNVPAPIYVLFQSTEPYFDQHRRRNVSAEMADAGFRDVQSAWNTKSHRTHTAVKGA